MADVLDVTQGAGVSFAAELQGIAEDGAPCALSAKNSESKVDSIVDESCLPTCSSEPRRFPLRPPRPLLPVSCCMAAMRRLRLLKVLSSLMESPLLRLNVPRRAAQGPDRVCDCDTCSSMETSDSAAASAAAEVRRSHCSCHTDEVSG